MAELVYHRYGNGITVEDIPNHPSIVLLKEITHTHGNTEDVFNTTCCLGDNMEKFCNDSGRTENNCKFVMLQLGHALEYMHGKRWLQGEIKLEDIYFTRNKEKVMVKYEEIQKESRDAEWQSKSRKDIYNLAKVFRSILGWNPGQKQVKCSDTFLAMDLLKMMVFATEATTKQVLQHAFFWTTAKKLGFLGKVSDFLANPIKGPEAKRSLQEKHRVEQGGWKQKLKITEEERDEAINSYRKKLKSRIKKVSSTQLLYCANSSMDESSVSDLVRFIRNRCEHFYQDGLACQACFKYDEVDGLYKFFFAKRFPRLFSDVYGVMRGYAKNNEVPMLNKGYLAEITETRINGERFPRPRRRSTSDICVRLPDYNRVTKDRRNSF